MAGIGGGQKTGVSVSISRGKAHKVYGDDLVTCLKKELRLSTMRDARHFLECQMDQTTYDQTVAPLMRWQPIAS